MVWKRNNKGDYKDLLYHAHGGEFELANFVERIVNEAYYDGVEKGIDLLAEKMRDAAKWLVEHGDKQDGRDFEQ